MAKQKATKKKKKASAAKGRSKAKRATAKGRAQGKAASSSKRSMSARTRKGTKARTKARPRPTPTPTIKTTGMTEKISDRIRYVRSLRGESKRVEALSSILLEVLDRFHMKELTQAVIEELGKTNHPKAIETLSFAWNNCQNRETRSHMVRALASFPQREVLRPLERIALSAGVSSELRVQAVEALGHHRTHASWTSLGNVLRQAAEVGDRPLQAAAIEALRRGNGKAVPTLIKALESEDEEEQVSAATALGIMGKRSALDPLKAVSNTTKSVPLREAATKSAILIYCS